MNLWSLSGRASESSASKAAVGRRIVIVGSTCSGKTTLARALSRRLGLPHKEPDALQWDTGWTPARPHVFRDRVEQALSADVWIADGNYSVLRDLVWSRADTLIWLDYSLMVILRRLTVRTSLRISKQTELWNGNVEHWS